MKTEAQILQSLRTWFKRESGLNVIIADQGTPRPARPYASIRFVVAGQRLGNSVDETRIAFIPAVLDNPGTPLVNEARAAYHEATTTGMRSATASLNIFGPSAQSLMAKVRDSLDRPDVIEEFDIAEISHIGEGNIQDLTALEETEYLERAQMDLNIGFVAESVKEIGIIESAEVSGTVSGGVEEHDVDVDVET